MLALLLLVTMLAPAALLLQHWRRPTPARIRYPRGNRSRSRHVR